MLTEDLCDWCKAKPETVGHALWGCPKAQEVWECSKLVLNIDRREYFSFIDILWQLLLGDNVNLDCAARLVMIAWKVWQSRNERHLSGVSRSGLQLMFGALQLWAEFLAANECDMRSSSVV